MKTCRLRIVFINYFKNLCNLRNLWIKSLFGCGSAALCPLLSDSVFCPLVSVICRLTSVNAMPYAFGPLQYHPATRNPKPVTRNPQPATRNP